MNKEEDDTKYDSKFTMFNTELWFVVFAFLNLNVVSDVKIIITNTIMFLSLKSMYPFLRNTIINLRLLPLDLITAEILVSVVPNLNYCDLIIPVHIESVEVLQENGYEHLFPIPSTLTTCYGRIKMRPKKNILEWRPVIHDTGRRIQCEYCGIHNTGVLGSTGTRCVLMLYKHLPRVCPFAAGDSAETTRKLLYTFNRNMKACNQFVKEEGIIEKLRKDFPFIQFPDTFIECLFYEDGTSYNIQ